MAQPAGATELFSSSSRRFGGAQEAVPIALASVLLSVPDDLLGALVRRAELVAEDMTGEDVTRTLWALAGLEAFHGKSLQESLDRQAMATASSMSPATIAGLLKAYPKLHRRPSERLISALAWNSEKLSASMRPGEAVGVLEAFRGVRADVPDLWLAIAKRLAQVAPEMDAKTMSQVLMAYSPSPTVAPSEQAASDVVPAAPPGMPAPLLRALENRTWEMVPDLNEAEVTEVFEAFSKVLPDRRAVSRGAPASLEEEFELWRCTPLGSRCLSSTVCCSARCGAAQKCETSVR